MRATVGALAAAQVVTLVLVAASAIWPHTWLRAVALLFAAGAAGATALVITAGWRERRREAQAKATLRAEIETLEEARGSALRIAAENEDLRVGYTEVFVNMFRRTQTLLQRQLQVIERLEQGDRSPADMHLFFQLDHLVTRMRRNNENVLVLAGTELVRATKNPVSIADVFRAAMSEVDKYQKIRVLSTPSVRVSNTAAGDLIRIIAELLDNAVSFSPPDKEVTINAELGRHHGLSIGVFDNGIGMSDEDILRTNDQLKKLGSVEIARSRRVGLFVVGRLAGRNGFKVELFGGDHVVGVSALISVPSAVLLEEDAVRATLPGDRKRLEEAQRRAVAVMTSVRRPDLRSAPKDARTRRMSSWYSSRSKAWRTDRENALEVKAHEDVPEELPIRVPRAPDPPPDPEPDPLPVREPAPVPEREPAPVPEPEGRGERVASRWFKAKDPAAPVEAPRPAQPWQVVEQAKPSTEYVLTEDGLPLRQQGAHLLPGSAGADAAPEKPREIRAVERDPAHMRRRLSSYQLGVQKAKENEDRMRGREQHAGGWTVLERKAEK